MYIRLWTSINKLYAHALLHKFKGQLCHAVVESRVMGALAVVVPTLCKIQKKCIKHPINEQNTELFSH